MEAPDPRPEGAAPAAMLAARLRGDGAAADDEAASVSLLLGAGSSNLLFNFLGWTAAERRNVLDAAQQNRSVRRVVVEAAGMSKNTAEAVACLVGRLARVEAVEINLALGGWACDFAADAVDALLRGIARTRVPAAVPITQLRLHPHASPEALLDFADRFPTLARIDLAGQCPGCCDKHCPRHAHFATAVAVAIGQLSRLREVRLNCVVARPLYVPTYLFALNAAPSVRTVELLIGHSQCQVGHSLSLLCGFATALERVVVKSIMVEPFDISSFFEVGARRSFAPCIEEMRFLRCRLDGTADSIAKATAALQHVETLRFGRCVAPAAFDLVQNLPNLKRFSSTSRTVFARKNHSLENEFDDTHYMLGATLRSSRESASPGATRAGLGWSRRGCIRGTRRRVFPRRVAPSASKPRFSPAERGELPVADERTHCLGLEEPARWSERAADPMLPLRLCG